LGEANLRGWKMGIFGISKKGDKGCELLFGVFTVLAFFLTLECALNDRYSKSEIFVIACSVAVALFYLSRVFGWWDSKLK
jgi:hypothetical protein